MEKINVMIIDTKDECELFRQKVVEIENFNLIACADDGIDAIDIARAYIPDVIIMEAVLPSCDGFEIAAKLSTDLPNCKFVMTTALSSSFYVDKAMKMGVDYYMIKPVDISVLAKRVIELFAEGHVVEYVSEEKRIEEKITNIFITVGIPAHIKGYQFLREAIKMTIKDPLIINSITKKLYPSIADMYDTSASKVERAIRHAIEVAWNKGKIENINDVFGLRVYDTNEKPTNGEFIALVADKMLLGVH